MTILFSPMCSAQSVEFQPEINAHLKVDSSVRAYLQAKNIAGTPKQFEFGPSIELYLKPLLKLKNITAFDLDDSKTIALVIGGGYRYITAPNTPPENRIETVATFHYPLKAGFLLSDRNRADLNWKNREFTWRYRNRLVIERTFGLQSYHLIPYVAAESYYESQYNK